MCYVKFDYIIIIKCEIIINYYLFNNIDITTLQGIHKTNNTAENTRMHEYIYLKTTKLYISLLHTGVNNVYQATLLLIHYIE